MARFRAGGHAGVFLAGSGFGPSFEWSIRGATVISPRVLEGSGNLVGRTGAGLKASHARIASRIALTREKANDQDIFEEAFDSRTIAVVDFHGFAI